MPDQIVEPLDGFLDAGPQSLMPLFEQGISLGDAAACGFARLGSAFDPVERALQPDHCRVDGLFRHKESITVPAQDWQRL